MTDSFLLDTCVLSEVSKRQPNQNVIRFLETSANVFVPAAALMEIQLGITEASSEDPVRAVRLSNWYCRTIAAGLPILDTTKEVAEVWGILAADPRLRGLIVGDGRAKKPRTGQDLHIAACALVHRLPIATMNVRDFVLIDRCHPLPGIYNPSEDRWHARLTPFSENEHPVASEQVICR